MVCALYDVGASYWFLAAADEYGLTLAASPLADLESCGERRACRGETALGLTLNLAMVRRESSSSPDWLQSRLHRYSYTNYDHTLLRCYFTMLG